ncbi:alpha-beta hydrolase superfamily lysophospholipase [Sedimentibacter acidaminivorans]|uniref:Alpha-beta hydrolase superfamily lysophospholipase n=1 Tax=Sedimentibacter acidaminivorans TaxID=913099 RepID=A0ABS4GEA5_9FIRM|nr:alpha/beta hydrolase [Sedimentibacter acidaminivorans]MBP1926028.1 alpha-beta hydrolase superfamily lysophospholipase [Sedimentibacter acidaminivorans]
MANKVEFYYDSADLITKIHAIKWVPDGEIKCILQIAHGMLEHIERYDEFANAMADLGIVVSGNDHLGHGSSLINEECRGFFSEGDGNKVVIDDMNKLNTILKEEYPNASYFILGHSMGSFLVRQYITIYNSGINGAIIVGTGHQPYALLKTGLIITKLIATFKGWRYRSKFVNNLAIGNNNKKFQPSRTNVDWLSRDKKIVDEYIKDKKIKFIFTLNSYYNMFKGMLTLYDDNNLKKMLKDLPIILLSGDQDPVGNFGKDIVILYDKYKKLGIKDVSYILYKEDRHEILNELDREKVYKDIGDWILHHM